MGTNRLFGVDVISACGVSRGCSVPCTRVQCDLGKVFNYNCSTSSLQLLWFTCKMCYSTSWSECGSGFSTCVWHVAGQWCRDGAALLRWNRWCMFLHSMWVSYAAGHPQCPWVLECGLWKTQYRWVICTEGLGWGWLGSIKWWQT